MYIFLYTCISICYIIHCSVLGFSVEAPGARPGAPAAGPALGCALCAFEAGSGHEKEEAFARYS